MEKQLMIVLGELSSLRDVVEDLKTVFGKISNRIDKIYYRPTSPGNHEILMSLTDLTCAVNNQTRKTLKPTPVKLRAMPQRCANFVLPIWNTHLQQVLKTSEANLRTHWKWTGTLENPVPPQFYYFITKFLSNPQNCGFARKGNRYYYCCRENDFWDMETDSKIYWGIVTEYCWTAYVEWFIELDTNHSSGFIKIIRDKLENMDNPLSKQYLYKLFSEVNPYINGRIKDLLQDAYSKRNKCKTF